MTINAINLGAAPNDGNGDPARTAFGIHNDNFSDAANMAAKLAQTSSTDVTADRGLLTDSLDTDGNVWGASNIEHGTNANGEFWKYPDGKLICRDIISPTSNLGISIGGSLFRSGHNAITFAEPFNSIPSLVAQLNVNSASGFDSWVGDVRNTNATSSQIQLYSTVATISDIGNKTIMYVAVGTWK